MKIINNLLLIFSLIMLSQCSKNDSSSEQIMMTSAQNMKDVRQMIDGIDQKEKDVKKAIQTERSSNYA